MPVNFPANVAVNSTYTVNGTIYVWNGSRWQIQGGTGGGGGSVDMTAIASNVIPAHNEVWSLGHSSYRWKDLYLSANSLWLGNIKITAGASGLQTITESGNVIPIAGGNKFTLSSTPPAAPTLGDRWMNAETYKEFIWMDDGTSQQWIQAVGDGGVIGATGPLGATGATGPTGPTGSPGGATGATGTAGIGISAATITSGNLVLTLSNAAVINSGRVTGSTGATGSAGPPGSDGVAGTVGATGATGPAGSAGAPGSAGVPGSAGPTGATGIQGATGPAGPTGSFSGTTASQIYTTNATASTSTSTGALVVSGGAGIGGSIFSGGSIYAVGDVVTNYSDIRLKQVLGPITNAIEKINKIDTFFYVPNELAKTLGIEGTDIQVGVSAQSVENQVSGVVTSSPVNPEYKTVRYERLVPLLIEAIKELQQQIDELKNGIQRQ